MGFDFQHALRADDAIAQTECLLVGDKDEVQNRKHIDRELK